MIRRTISRIARAVVRFLLEHPDHTTYAFLATILGYLLYKWYFN